MGRRNQLELSSRYSDQDFLEKFGDLFALRMLLDNSVVVADWKPQKGLGESIVLTPEGEQLVSLVGKVFKGMSEDEIKLAIFLRFYHYELLIDVDKSNADQIARFISDGIIGEKIRYPWAYGHILYDRFFELFPELTEELSVEDTEKLLEGTPQGVFQVRGFVVGPFGLLRTGTDRFLEPILELPLWHCSDPACEQLHVVKLSRGKWDVGLAANMISEETEKKGNGLSEWDGFFRNACLDRDYYDDMHTANFPWLLANCFSKREKRLILSKLTDMYPGQIRGLFPKGKKYRNVFSGTSEKICEKMSESESFQLILLMPENAVIHSLECLIDEGKIVIPATETRVSRTSYGSFGWLDVMCECSRFGVRFFSRRAGVALGRLRRLLMELNNKGTPSSQLNWKLRHVDGGSVQEKLDVCIHDEEPRAIIRDFLFVSRENLEQGFKFLRYGRFELPDNPAAELHLVDKVLWKLGFDVCLHPEYLRLFWERFDNLLGIIGKHTGSNHRAQDLIRSAGVNFFVSLEEILDYSLSFFTWVLLSDHYGVTRFRCNFEKARRFMAGRLSGRKSSSQEEFDFDPNGKNTLYPLTRGFKILANVCLELIQNGGSKLQRGKGDLPGYYMKTDVEQFPFMHTVFLLDLSKKEQEEIINLLMEVARELDSSNVCGVRNRIEHRRVDFPNRDEIKESCDTVAQIIRKMEKVGICPMVYVYREYRVDQFSRGVAFLEDYRGGKFELRVPGQLMFSHLPSPTETQIIVPCLHLGESADVLRFSFEEGSDYVDLWKDYPKRRTRLSSEIKKRERKVGRQNELSSSNIE